MQRILVIEDEPSIRKIAVRILTGAGYEVVDAGSGLEGLRAWRDRGADLIITDLRMQDVNGMDVISELGTTAPSLPIIVVSGDTGGQADLLRAAMQTRPISLLRKPFRAGELLAIVRDAIGDDPGSRPLPS